jgi:hypothetical protein
MANTTRVLVAGAIAALAVGVGGAAANNGQHLGKPPTADAGVAVAPNPLTEGVGVEFTVTVTVNSSPGTIDGGAVEVDAPAGWTITDAVIDDASTCDILGATVTLLGNEIEVAGVSCSTGDTLVLDLTGDTPDVTQNTDYSFGGSIKSSPGGRRWFHNVYLLDPGTVTVQPAV